MSAPGRADGRGRSFKRKSSGRHGADVFSVSDDSPFSLTARFQAADCANLAFQPNHNLPDFVAALHGIVDIQTVARIDSKNGGIGATFADLPDAPISKVVVRMQGGKKGLIINSTDICRGRHRADVQIEGSERARPLNRGGRQAGELPKRR